MFILVGEEAMNEWKCASHTGGEIYTEKRSTLEIYAAALLLQSKNNSSTTCTHSFRVHAHVHNEEKKKRTTACVCECHSSTH